jgi:hypothetical protein
MTRPSFRVVPTMLVFSLAAGSPAFAQTPLPQGAPATGSATSEAPAEYTTDLKSAGVLSIAVQGTGDLALSLLDQDGQALPDGTSDRDLNGSTGTELLSVTITEPGPYRVRVRQQGSGSSTFQIASSFLAFPAFARPSDADGRPGQARTVAVGKPHDDALDPGAGDSRDWFVFKAPKEGALAIVTRPLANSEADLVLEVFLNGDFAQSADRSDQDMQGNSSSESVTVNVTSGQLVHVKVTNQSGRAGKYRLSSSLIQ